MSPTARLVVELVEAKLDLNRARVELIEAQRHGDKVSAENAALRLELAMLTDRHARLISQMMTLKEGAREVAATPISMRRAEALLNHLAAGGPEGTNARLRLLEALCGERT